MTAADLARRAYDKAGELGLTHGETRMLVWMSLEAIPGTDGYVFCRGRESLVDGHGGGSYRTVREKLQSLKACGVIEQRDPAHPGSPAVYVLHV